MIHILLLLLKVIGILLLVLILLLLFLVLIILFSPIRYRFFAEYDQEFEGEAGITWLSHMISLQMRYEDNKFLYTVKIFGITIFPKRKKSSHQRQKVHKKKEVPETIGHLSPPSKKENTGGRKQEEKPKKEDVNREEPVETVMDTKENNQEEEEVFPVRIEDKPESKKRKSFGIKVKSFVKKIKKTIRNIKRFFRSIPKKIKRYGRRIEDIKKKIKEYRDFYKEEATQNALRLGKNLAKKFILHTLPRKFRGVVTFGTSDPALTGQILGILSMGMPIYKDKLQLCPVFDETTFQFRVEGKGKIQIGYYVYLVLHAVINKDVRYVIKKAMTKFK